MPDIANRRSAERTKEIKRRKGYIKFTEQVLNLVKNGILDNKKDVSIDDFALDIENAIDENLDGCKDLTPRGNVTIAKALRICLDKNPKKNIRNLENLKLKNTDDILAT